MYLLRKKLIYTIAFLFFMGNAMINHAQNIGINNTGDAPDNSAMLDISATDKGVLIPRMDSTSRMNIATPAEGLMVFDSTYHSFYFYDGTAWAAIGEGDNLGDHKANQNLLLNNNWLNNDGDANEGIYVDTLGNVGIGEKPSSTFHVKINSETVSQVMVDNNSNAQGLAGNPAVYQTFTATATDSISKVAVSFTDVIGPMGTGEDKVMNIYEGTGTGGNLLFTSAPVFVPNYAGAVSFDFPVSGVEVTNGQVYSIYFADGGGVGINSNGYTGGELSLSPTLDMAFSITSFHITENPGLSVSDTGIELNNYTVPLADGSPGQILATDGSGNVNWTSPVDNDSQQLTLSNDSLFLTNDASAISLNPYLDNTDNQDLTIANDSLFLTNDASAINLAPYLDNTDNQQLTLSGDNLSLTDGGTPISLTPYLDADNLGNHTASQDLTIGEHKIRKSASNNTAIYIDEFNRTIIESSSTVPAFFQSTSNVLGSSNGAFIEVTNNAGTRALFGPDGNGFSGGDTTDVILANWSTGNLNLFTSALQRMRIDASGKVGIGMNPVTNLLEVQGNASKTTAGNWLANSDARLKKNIAQLSSGDMLNKLLSLRGVTYEWNDLQTGAKRPEGIQYGFIAQNIQEVFPTLVTEDNNGFLQTPYGTYDAMTVEAIRALNDKIEELENKNAAMESRLAEIDELKNSFAELKALLVKEEVTTQSAKK